MNLLIILYFFANIIYQKAIHQYINPNITPHNGKIATPGKKKRRISGALARCSEGSHIASKTG